MGCNFILERLHCFLCEQNRKHHHCVVAALTLTLGVNTIQLQFDFKTSRYPSLLLTCVLPCFIEVSTEYLSTPTSVTMTASCLKLFLSNQCYHSNQGPVNLSAISTSSEGKYTSVTMMSMSSEGKYTCPMFKCVAIFTLNVSVCIKLQERVLWQQMLVFTGSVSIHGEVQ